MQIGARAEAFFGFDALSVEGYFGFDALLRFSPLYLIVEISTGFSVKVFGIGVLGVHLRGSLEGPTPWHITGSASIELLFFCVSRRRRRDVRRAPRRDAAADRGAARRSRRSSRSSTAGGPRCPAPDGCSSACASSATPTCSCCTRSGSLQVSQRFAPAQPAARQGRQPEAVRTSTRPRVSVDAGGVAGRARPARENVRRGAVPRHGRRRQAVGAGVRAARERRRARRRRATPGPPVRRATRNVRYETIIVDTAFERHTIAFFEFWAELFAHFVAGAAIAKSDALAGDSEQRHQPFADKVAVAGDRLRRRAPGRQQPRSAARPRSASHAEATAHLADGVAADPTLADTIHVIPCAEVNVGGMSDQPIAVVLVPAVGPPGARRPGRRRPTRRDRAASAASIDVTLHDQRRQDRRRHDVTEPVAATSQLYGPGDVIGIDAASDRAHRAAQLDHQLRDQLPAVRRVLRGGLPLALHAGQAVRRRAAAAPVADARRPRGGRVRPTTRRCRTAAAVHRGDRPGRARSPPADTLWAWAHVHVNGALGGDPERPRRQRARLGADGRRQPRLGLLAAAQPAHPREPTPAYHAFVVPTFESGRLAGLGKDPDGAAFADPGRLGRRPDRPGPRPLPRLPPLVLPHGRGRRLRVPRAAARAAHRRLRGSAGATIDVQDPGAEPAGDPRARRRPAPGRRAAGAAQHAERRRARRVRASTSSGLRRTRTPSRARSPRSSTSPPTTPSNAAADANAGDRPARSSRTTRTR